MICKQGRSHSPVVKRIHSRNDLWSKKQRVGRFLFLLSSLFGCVLVHSLLAPSVGGGPVKTSSPPMAAPWPHSPMFTLPQTSPLSSAASSLANSPRSSKRHSKETDPGQDASSGNLESSSVAPEPLYKVLRCPNVGHILQVCGVAFSRQTQRTSTTLRYSRASFVYVLNTTGKRDHLSI